MIIKYILHKSASIDGLGMEFTLC